MEGGGGRVTRIRGALIRASRRKLGSRALESDRFRVEASKFEVGTSSWGRERLVPPSSWCGVRAEEVARLSWRFQLGYGARSDGQAAASLAHVHSNLIDSESRRPNLRSGRARGAENGSQHDRVPGWDLSGLWT